MGGCLRRRQGAAAAQRGQGGHIDLTVVETLAQDNEKDRDLGTDRPGRANGADGSSRSAMKKRIGMCRQKSDF